MVRGDRVLKLVERAGRNCQEAVVLRAERKGGVCGRDESEGQGAEPVGVSVADGGGVGVCLPSRDRDALVDGRGGGVASEIWPVSFLLGGPVLSRRVPAAERAGVLRLARQRVGVVPGPLRSLCGYNRSPKRRESEQQK